MNNITHVSTFFPIPFFHKYPLWRWDDISPLYRNSPYLTLDCQKEGLSIQNRTPVDTTDVNTVEVENVEAESNDENNEFEDSNDRLEIPHEDILVNEINTNKSNVTPKECREALNTIKNLTYDVDEKSTVFSDVQDHLRSILSLLRNATKKEKGIIVRPIVNVTNRRKRRFLDIAKKKKRKTAKRFGAASSRFNEAAKIKVEKIKVEKKSAAEEILLTEDIVVDDIDMNGQLTFTAPIIPTLQVFDVEDTEDEEESNNVVNDTLLFDIFWFKAYQ